MTGPHVIGIDLGGSHTRAILADGSGRILARCTGVTNSKQLIDHLEDVIGGLAHRSPEGSVVRTVIGIAGVPNDGTGLNLAPNLEMAPDTPLGSRLQERVGHTVTLANDVDMAAFGELRAGIGSTVRDFVVVAVGTGLGAGLVSNGHLLHGAHGAAGEVGYLPFGADPLDRRFHRHGALEEVASGKGITRAYHSRTGVELPATEIFRRAVSGDLVAAEVTDAAARWVAAALSTLAAVLDPETAILTGGIGSRDDFRIAVGNWLVKHGVDLPIISSTTSEPPALIGAIHLALELEQT